MDSQTGLTTKSENPFYYKGMQSLQKQEPCKQTILLAKATQTYNFPLPLGST